MAVFVFIIVFVYFFESVKLLQFIEQIILLDGPILTLGEFTIWTFEHFGCLLATLQLPVEPSEGYH
jgi:hypothetical protein